MAIITPLSSSLSRSLSLSFVVLFVLLARSSLSLSRSHTVSLYASVLLSFTHSHSQHSTALRCALINRRALFTSHLVWALSLRALFDAAGWKSKNVKIQIQLVVWKRRWKRLGWRYRGTADGAIKTFKNATKSIWHKWIKIYTN